MPMEICEAIPMVPAPLPVISRSYRKTQLPVYDTFGPFPDETLLSSIDRVLYFLGVDKVVKVLHLSPTLDEYSCSSDCSITISNAPCSCPCSDCTTYVSPVQRCDSPCRTVSILKNCTCRKCDDATSQTTMYKCKPICKCGSSTSRSSKSSATSRVQIADPKDCLSPEDIAAMARMHQSGGSSLKRSFSLCSLACRKVKKLLTFQCPKGPQRACKPKWLWTRMQCGADGCEVYEIFRESEGCKNPRVLERKATPKIIFVVLQNGTIMPFEILKCH